MPMLWNWLLHYLSNIIQTYDWGINFNEFSGCYQSYQPLIGDGFCDDETNNVDCGFDGGDCCLDSVVTNFCSECECLEGSEGTIAPSTISSTSTTKEILFKNLQNWQKQNDKAKSFPHSWISRTKMIESKVNWLW